MREVGPGGVGNQGVPRAAHSEAEAVTCPGDAPQGVWLEFKRACHWPAARPCAAETICSLAAWKVLGILQCAHPGSL